MENPDEEVDVLNAETFGGAEEGDWESLHERLVFDGDFVTDACSPKADELPRFWEDGGDLSFLWRTETIPDPNSSKDADCKESLLVDVEETIRRLVSEEDSYEDPAIIDVSKRANYFPFNASSNHQVPAFTYAPEAVFDSSKDIWGCHKGQNFEEISLNMCNQTFSSRHETQDSSPPIESSNGSDLLKKFLIQLKLGSAKTLPTPTSNISTSSMKESLERSNHRFIPHEFKTRDTISLNKSLNGVTSHRMDIPFSQPGEEINLNKPELSIPPHENKNNSYPTQSRYTYGNAMIGSHNTSFNSLKSVLPLLQHGSSPDGNIFSPSNNFVKKSDEMQQKAQPEIHSRIIYDQISRSDHSSFSLHSRSFDTQSTTSKNLPQNPPCSNNQMQIKQRTSTFDSIGYKAQTGDLGQNFEEFESEEFDFDPERDCWMTDNERNWVLKVQLSPLIAVNPYMQDYYFAVQWLRNLSTRRNQLLSMGQYPRDLQSPIFQLPSPLSIESLLEPNHPHHLAIRHRLAISGYLNSDTSSHLPLESLRSSTTGSEVDKNSLGKPTKSSVHTPRQVAELSVANALSELHAEQVSNLPNRPVSNHMLTDCNSRVSRNIIVARHKRLLLAKVERLFSIVLSLDEVDLSLARLIVQNETRSRFTQHRSDLIQALKLGLSEPSQRKDLPIIPNTLPVSLNQEKREPLINFDILSIRKGVRLFSIALRYFSPLEIRTFLIDFFRRFSEIATLYKSAVEEYSWILYPDLRRCIYLIYDFKGFLDECFPYANRLQESSPLAYADLKKHDPSAFSLSTSSLGISLIFCLLDACARVSKPNDPSNFRQLGAYFCLLINDPQNPPSSTRLASFEAFTHLASILPVYLNLETCPPALNISTVQIERGLRPADLFNGLKRLIGLAQPSNQSGSPSDTTAGVSELAVTETPSQLKCPTISPEIVTDKPSSNPTALLAGI